jgi:hypothetical protein
MLLVWVHSVLNTYSEIALSREPFGIRHMYMYAFLLRMVDTLTSQNTKIFFWSTLYTLYIFSTIF